MPEVNGERMTASAEAVMAELGITEKEIEAAGDVYVE